MANKDEFEKIINELIINETVLKMKNFRQHFDTSCYDHCYNVAYDCYRITKKLNLDYKSATRAAMLHDLYLYDWRTKIDRNNIHAFTHGKIACQNAIKEFSLNQKEKDMIIKHMWPTTLVPPKSREGFILTVVDKKNAVEEGIYYLLKMLKSKKFKKIHLL